MASTARFMPLVLAALVVVSSVVFSTLTARVTAAPAPATRVGASRTSDASDASGAALLTQSQAESADSGEAVTVVPECDPEGLLLTNAGVYEVRGGPVLGAGDEADASDPESALVRTPCPIQLLAPDTMRVRLTFLSSSFSCANPTESYFYVSNTFVVGERVFTPDGLRAALAARFNVPCDLPSASAPAEEAAAGRVWVSDGNVGQVMHTLHSSRSPAAAGSAFASVRFRLDFLPNPSPCNVFAWAHSGRVQLTLPPGRSSCTFVHLNPIRFQLGLLSVPVWSSSSASSSSSVAASAGLSSLASHTRARTQSRSKSSVPSAAAAQPQSLTQPNSHELSIERVFSDVERRARATYGDDDDTALRRPQSLLDEVERINELQIRREALSELETMCEALESATYVEILERPFGELIRRHRLCGRSDTLPARSKLRFRTSCAGEATSVRLVRRAAASSLASAALVSSPITSSATAGGAQSASASASQVPVESAPSAWLTIRYEEEDVTAREARCGVAATEADGVLPIAPEGSGSAPAISSSQ